jgi:hypothetical protein
MMASLSPKEVTGDELQVPSCKLKVKNTLAAFNFELATWNLQLTTRHPSLVT